MKKQGFCLLAGLVAIWIIPFLWYSNGEGFRKSVNFFNSEPYRQKNLKIDSDSRPIVPMGIPYDRVPSTPGQGFSPVADFFFLILA